MQYYVISDNHDTLLGLRLAGIEGVVVHTAKEVEEELKRVKSNPHIGIVLLTHTLSALCSSTIEQMKLNSPRPLLIEIPDRHGAGGDATNISQTIREAIGLKM